MGSDLSINKKEINLNLILNYCTAYYNTNINNEYYIIRKKDDVILFLGKVIKCESKYEYERMCWHDGPIYNLLYNEIVFEKSDTIDDEILIEKFKKFDENSVKYLIENYSNLFIV